MSYEVKTAVFEGPLELLLQLITARRVEITEVSLSDLVTEYLGYLDLMRQLDLEVTSEFLVIASTLIQLKARRLLPDDIEVDLDEDLALAEERDRLLSRLLACLTFKDVAAVLAHRMQGMERLVGRSVGLDPGLRPAPPELRFTASAADLAEAATRVFEAARREPDLDHLDLDLPSVETAIDDVRARLRQELTADFESITAHCSSDREMIAYFLAILELCRWGMVAVAQEHLAAEITIEHRSDTPLVEIEAAS